MSASLTDHAIEILQKTNDGEDLDPKHLKIVEYAVNGLLNQTGLHLFYDLLENVRGGYVRPWFHGVEHVTRNHQGYVLWKGVAIEHYSGAYAHSDEAAENIRELARRCAILEGKGVTPDTNSVVWRWSE